MGKSTPYQGSDDELSTYKILICSYKYLISYCTDAFCLPHIL